MANRRKKKIGDVVRYQQTGTGFTVWGCVEKISRHGDEEHPVGPILLADTPYLRPGIVGSWRAPNCEIIPIDEVPAEVCAALAVWKMTGEFDDERKD